jgi:hypothetical protein
MHIQTKAKEILERTTVHPNPVDGFDIVGHDGNEFKVVVTLIPEQGGFAIWEAFNILQSVAMGTTEVKE